MNIQLASYRARHRVQVMLHRELPWRCAFGQGPKAACTTLTEAEWQRVQTKGWPGITPCTRCRYEPDPQLGML